MFFLGLQQEKFLYKSYILLHCFVLFYVLLCIVNLMFMYCFWSLIIWIILDLWLVELLLTSADVRCVRWDGRDIRIC